MYQLRYVGWQAKKDEIPLSQRDSAPIQLSGFACCIPRDVISSCSGLLGIRVPDGDEISPDARMNHLSLFQKTASGNGQNLSTVCSVFLLIKLCIIIIRS